MTADATAASLPVRQRLVPGATTTYRPHIGNYWPHSGSIPGTLVPMEEVLAAADRRDARRAAQRRARRLLADLLAVQPTDPRVDEAIGLALEACAAESAPSALNSQ